MITASKFRGQTTAGKPKPKYPSRRVCTSHPLAPCLLLTTVLEGRVKSDIHTTNKPEPVNVARPEGLHETVRPRTAGATRRTKAAAEPGPKPVPLTPSQASKVAAPPRTSVRQCE